MVKEEFRNPVHIGRKPNMIFIFSLTLLVAASTSNVFVTFSKIGLCTETEQTHPFMSLFLLPFSPVSSKPQTLKLTLLKRIKIVIIKQCICMEPYYIHATIVPKHFFKMEFEITIKHLTKGFIPKILKQQMHSIVLKRYVKMYCVEVTCML